MKLHWSQNLQFWLRNGLKLPCRKRDFWVFVYKFVAKFLFLIHYFRQFLSFRDNTVSSDTVTKDSVPKASVSKVITSKEPVLQNTVSKDTAPKDPVFKDTASKEPVLENTVSKGVWRWFCLPCTYR